MQQGNLTGNTGLYELGEMMYKLDKKALSYEPRAHSS